MVAARRMREAAESAGDVVVVAVAVIVGTVAAGARLEG